MMSIIFFNKDMKKSIFSYNTELFLLGITEVTLNKIDITVSREHKEDNDMGFQYLIIL